MERLRETRIDLAACIEPRAAADLEIRPLFKDELLLALSPGHPWGDDRPVSSEELSRQTVDHRSAEQYHP